MSWSFERSKNEARNFTFLNITAITLKFIIIGSAEVIYRPKNN